MIRGVLALLVLAALGGGSAADPLYNRGDLALAGATIDGEVISPAGSTITVEGVVVFNGPFRGAAEFHGRGTAVFNGGSSPGDSPAIVTVEGGVRFGPANTLLIELGGTAPGAFDRLEIQGALEAGGTLVVALLPGFAGNPGDSYEIFTAAAITGSFTYVPPPIGAGLTLALRQTATSMRLTVAADCNGNGLADSDEIAQGLAGDCNGNQVPDGCDLAGGTGDSNANGFLDTCEVTRLDVTRTGLSWTPLAIADAYDVIAGDLATLRASGGDFTAATQICLAENQPGTALPHATDPGPGAGLWFLVRGAAGAVNLSWDTFTSDQVGSRDAEIAASAMACQ
jgi:hypothetical protein